VGPLGRRGMCRWGYFFDRGPSLPAPNLWPKLPPGEVAACGLSCRQQRWRHGPQARQERWRHGPQARQAHAVCSGGGMLSFLPNSFLPKNLLLLPLLPPKLPLILPASSSSAHCSLRSRLVTRRRAAPLRNTTSRRDHVMKPTVAGPFG
jgi:hypothetical protein